MKLHLSPRAAEWLECRAKEGNCPFGSHEDLQTIFATAHDLHGKDEPVPPVRTTAGTVRPFEFLEDGTVRLGKRRYTKEGAPLLVASSLRARASRARKAVQAAVLTVAEKITKAERLVARLLDLHGLRKLGTVFRWNQRTKTLGITKFLRGRPHSVELSKKWVKVLPWEDIEDTITHEVAHALVGPGHGHDEVWQAKHRELGGSGQACYENSSVDLERPWRWTCSSCGRSGQQLTAPPRVQACGRCCGGGFDARFVFDWEKNGTAMPPESMSPKYRANWEWLKEKYAL